MDYPVMLYRDSFDDWAIADDDEHEAELLKSGFTTHADFMAKDKNGNGAIDTNELTKDDIMQRLDALGETYNKRDSKDKLAAQLKDSE